MQQKTESMQNARKYLINYHVAESYHPNHNFAEGVICEIRKKWYRIKLHKLVRQRLWDHWLQLTCDIQNRTSNRARGLDGRCPLEQESGKSVDISEYLDFGFYNWVLYRNNAGLGMTKLGRRLGGSHQIGTIMIFLGTNLNWQGSVAHDGPAGNQFGTTSG